jgi:hypothetical protein
MLLDTVRNLQLCIAAVWGAPFGEAFQHFIDLQQDRFKIAATHHHPAAYIASMLEGALHKFHVIVFSELGGSHAQARCTPAGCAGILESCLKSAADYSLWEAYPLALFFAPDGHYIRHCKPSKAATSHSAAKKSAREDKKKKAKAKVPLVATVGASGKAKAATAGTGTTTGKQRSELCGYYIAKWLQVPGMKECPRGKECRFSHDKVLMGSIPKDEVLAEMKRVPFLPGGEETLKKIEASTGIFA